MKLQKMSPAQKHSIQSSNARVNLWSGSVRSGKTIASIIRWIYFVAHAPPGNLLMVGKTERTLRRNILDVIMDLVGPQSFRVTSGLGECMLYGRKIYLVGANDERSESKIRGVSLLAAYGDEITLWPESFFTMLLSRLSEPNATFFGTTNPDSPAHWLKKSYIDRKEEIRLNLFTFTLDDNQTLPTDYVKALKIEYTGLWYKRYILGLWVAAVGAIFDMFSEEKHVVHDIDLPKNYSSIITGVDYGTSNPSAFVSIGLASDGPCQGKWIAFSEYFYDSRTANRQKTDSEYSSDMRTFLKQAPDSIEIDPSAASFKVQLAQDGFDMVADADNAVLDGIRDVSQGFSTKTLFIHDSCQNLIDSISGYVWDPKAQAKGEDKPLKSDDHPIDALRYAFRRAVLGLPTKVGWGVSRLKGKRIT